MVAVAVACAGIIIGCITHTGLGLVFLSSVLYYSKGQLLIILFMVMTSCIIFGMGLPTSAAYVMVATLSAPALLELDLDPMAVHLFCFYFAIMAAITPPVAICAYAAASIAHSNPPKTGIEAFKLAIAGMILPYAFIYNNALIAKGPLWKIIISFFLALVGMTLIAKGVSGYFANQNINLAKSVKFKYLQLALRIGLILLGMFIIFIPSY